MTVLYAEILIQCSEMQFFFAEMEHWNAAMSVAFLEMNV